MNKEDLISYKKKIAELSEKEKRLRDLELRKYATGELQGPPVGYASVDKPWLKYFHHDIENSDIKEESMFQFVKRSNALNMNKTAIELRTSSNGFDKGFSITYKDFFNKVEKAASALKQMGVKPNEIVATILPNIPESRILIYALNMIGATVYPLNFMLPAKNVEQIINENNIKHAFVFDAFYSKYENVLNESNIKDIVYLDGKESLPVTLRMLLNVTGKKTKLPNSNKVMSYFDFLKHAKKEKIEPYYDSEHIAVIVGTSGTTGVPKGVCLTDKSLNAIAQQLGYSDAFKRDSVFLDALIQSIGYGLTAMHCATYIGLHTIVIPELITDRIGEVLAKVKPNSFSGGPVHAINIERSKEYKNGEIPVLDNFMCGGASLDKNLEKRMNNVEEGYYENGEKNPDIFIRQGLGATENGGSGTYAVEGSYKFGGVGVPLPLVTFGIFKFDTDEELGPNETGEICISGPTIMKEYLNNPEETSKVLKKHSDGTYWIHLADVGMYDEDGQIYHIDRVKNLFMRTGFNIHPNKIREYLNTIPMIKDNAVIGIEHPDEQMVPVAFIVLNEEYKNLSYDEIVTQLHNICYQNIDELYIPYDWYIVDQMPMNLSGKIDTITLKNMANISYFDNKDGQKNKYLSLK